MKKQLKVMISYPPLEGGGTPLLSQNRQFQWFNSPTYIYPVAPASAATLLKKAGFEVVWNDCIAGEWDHAGFIDFVKQQRPAVIAFETKTPVVKQHWKIIDELKGLAAGDWTPATVLFGDHVTALPGESFENSRVDYVLTGGDYDFLLLNLCEALRDGSMASLEPGIWYREGGGVKNTGQFKLNHDLNSLPPIDRDLTEWRLYAYKNGNYKRTPGAYIMSARDCWWGRCTFCSWPALYPAFRSRRPQNVLDEIGILITKHGAREIMDDSGTFPTGDWLGEFCRGMIKAEYGKKTYLDCNMRFGCLSSAELALMKKANFRLLLFGLESANQKTLDRLNKNLRLQDVVDGCKNARRAGLYPHITIMFGYPWETYEDARQTVKLGAYLLKKGYAHTVQATVVIPYPGSLLYKECVENGWLTTRDWSRFDMKEPVMKTSMTKEELAGLVRQIYKVGLSPEFLFNRLKGIRDLDDIKYFQRAGSKIIGHIMDFRNRS